VENKTNSSSEITKTGGGQANNTGNALESFVGGILQRKGYVEFWDHKDQIFVNRKTVGGKQYAEQVPCGMSIYDSPRKCDFLVLNKDKFPDGLIIECKWQESAGSVDEKYPFAVFNILKIGVPTIILLDGGGYKKTAMAWLKSQATGTTALIGVYNMAEFQKLTNGDFLG